MCLYPKRIQNKKYIANKKNGGIIPDMPIIGYTKDTSYDIINEDTGEVTRIKRGSEPIYDDRIAYVEVPCGECIECREARARDWQVRLREEIKIWKYKYFITLTFSPAGLREICFKYKIGQNNAAATFALRHAIERYRKDKKHTLRHWFITELGHEGTERIHMHGLIMTNEPLEFEKIERKGDGYYCNWKYWKYGIIYVGDYVNDLSINYVVKYMSKIDNDHPDFKGVILASPGIGANFITRLKENNDHSYKYRPRETKDFYRLPNGKKIKLPKYYSNKLRTEEEREKIWREFMDKEKESILGITYDKKIKNNVINNIREKAKEFNKQRKYGDDSKGWKNVDTNITKRMLQDQARYKAQIQIIEKMEINNLATPEMIQFKEKLKNKIKND